jgi:serine/threonine protein kinase
MKGNLAELASALDCRARVHAMQAVTSALCALHAEDICHRDVKASNVLLASNGAVYLSDCGLAQTPDMPIGEHAGEPGYCDPEVFIFHAAPLTHAVDVYGLGIFMVELLSGASASRRESLGPDFLRAHTRWAVDSMVRSGDDARADFQDRFQSTRWTNNALFGVLAGAAATCLRVPGCMRPSVRDMADTLDYAARLLTDEDPASPLAYRV